MARSKTVVSPTNNPPKAPKTSTFIAKVAAPFVSKQRNLLDQHIKLDEPFRHYFPGDSIKGTVHLNVTKALRATHLVIRLHGFVKVINSAKLPGESIAYDEALLTSSKGRRGIEYFGNGFARLFEDENILCGDGRLYGRYEFCFELMLPPKNVPSSIDFEHGTISYLLSSTLTRPTTISPTFACHRKLNVKETIDVAPVPKPKPHTALLEALGKKSKSRGHKRRSLPFQSERIQRPSGQNGSAVEPNLPAQNTIDEPPLSPSPSEIDNTSVTSSNTSSNPAGINVIFTGESSADASSLALSEKTITAHTEVSQGGCLPGDTLGIKVSVDHIKAIKSMQGIIITLYRQCRIDTHPTIPLGPAESAGRRRYEDYYPRSRTGLGGLSLSSAGSSRAFRQDLAQTVAPLIIDPLSLTAVIKTHIQVPEHCFPTITCVPGSMISFKYYVEVVIDLRGKLPGQDRLLNGLNMIDMPQHAYGDPKISRVDGPDGINFSATPGFNYLITDQIRRTKGVVFSMTEVIIGTRDSARTGAKQRENSDSSEVGIDGASSIGHENEHRPRDLNSDGYDTSEYSQEQVTWQQDLQSRENDAYVAPPPEAEGPVDEKAQIRRAEQTLLPSAPPDDSGSMSVTAVSPTAPFAYDEEDFVHRYRLHVPAPAYGGPSFPSSTNTTSLSIVPQSRTLQTEVPAPNHVDCQDDKQELERQRLQALAISPHDHDHDHDTQAEAAKPRTTPMTPSAPILFEDDLPNPTLSPPSPPPVILRPEDQDQEPTLERQPTEIHSPDNSVAVEGQQTQNAHLGRTTLDAQEAPLANGHAAQHASDDENPPVYKR